MSVADSHTERDVPLAPLRTNRLYLPRTPVRNATTAVVLSNVATLRKTGVPVNSDIKDPKLSELPPTMLSTLHRR